MNRRTLALPKSKEAPILRGALELLELRGFPAWRTNSGALKTGGRFVRFGFAGCADVLGVVPDSGRLLAVETKRPKGKPTEAQWAFLRAVQQAGGVALVVDDLARLDLALARLQRDPWARLDIATGEPIPAGPPAAPGPPPG